MGKTKKDVATNKLFFTKGGFGIKKLSREVIKKNLPVIRKIAEEGERKRKERAAAQGERKKEEKVASSEE